MGLFNKLFNGSKQEPSSQINWNALNELPMLDKAIALSHEQPVVLFKHSTRCSISSMAKNRLERGWDFEEGQGPTMYLLDLIAYRPISNAIASELGVIHESPQLILLKNGKVVMYSSHSAISVDGIHKALEA